MYENVVKDYQTKLNRLLNLIDEKSKNNKISLIGTSAGGSLVINAFSERKDNINKIITVCSRLKKGKDSGFRGFVKRTKRSLSFKESVLNSEKNINNFSLKDKEKIITVHALFGDELIPKNTAIINGVKNITITTGEHLFSIWSSLSWYSKQLREFIETD
jgi:poly(3-hydroxyalkanoate) synthetase